MKISIIGQQGDGKTRLLNEAILPWFKNEGRRLAILDGGTQQEMSDFLEKTHIEAALFQNKPDTVIYDVLVIGNAEA